MSIKNIPLTEATDEQKRQFVTHFLNLEVAADASPNQIEALIQQAQPGTTMIFFEEADEVAPAPAVAPPSEDAPLPPELLKPEEVAARGQGTLGKGDPRWLIEIPIVESDDGTGSRDVEVGVNGRAWQMKRGVPLSVPHRVVVALDLAVADIVRDNMETGDRMVHQAKRFPYQVHERPTAAEIADWHTRTDAEFCA